MIRVSLLLATYGRPQQAVDIFKRWVNNADRPRDVEFLLGMDDIDNTVVDYYNAFNVDEINKIGRFEINIGTSRNIVQALNRVAKTISDTSELIMQISDDMDTIPSWDTELFKMLDGVDNFKDPKYIVACDGVDNLPGVHHDGIERCCYVMINRAFYNRLGYLLYEEYSGLGADEDLFAVARLLNAIVDARHLYFNHMRWESSGAKVDDTYLRSSNTDIYWKGQKILLERKARNFDLGDIK